MGLAGLFQQDAWHVVVLNKPLLCHGCCKYSPWGQKTEPEWSPRANQKELGQSEHKVEGGMWGYLGDVPRTRMCRF